MSYARRVSTKVTDSYRVLREGIATGAYRLGEPLRAATIAGELGISRTPVREAFMRLASEGLVDYSPRYGARVSDLRAEELEELFELRAAIEAVAVRHACARATPADVAHLRRLCTACHDAVGADDVDAVIAANIALHDAVNRLSGRERTIELVDLLRDRARPYRVLALYDDDERRASLAEHDDLVDLIEAGDADGAAALLGEHFARPLARLMRYLGDRGRRPQRLAS
ncbi:GntR family transcriptional regulator [Baekduia soli]|uniref:GntR family transcriptional regulator n=1 Tax=Baekduia soli TaxID=496014 RepID=A0A5B8UBF7_9ACTN|nr:GntR family transcriptional regulator [Baekduia soli]